jgi:DNA (cytosine-5)-methyltransferase 1
MGSRQGVDDPSGRGLIIEHIIAALATKLPRVFLLENVKGLVTQHRRTFDHILHQLRTIAGSAYLVGYKILDTADHGLPQHRERVYIVGFLRSSYAARFKWPVPRPRRSLQQVLRWTTTDKRKVIVKERKFMASASPKLKQRLITVLKRIRQKGVGPRDQNCPVVADIDGSKPHWMHGISPCLTRARAATGHYLPARGRRLTIKERLLLQGLPLHIHKRCRGHVSNRQLGAMIGNSLSLNVIKALLSRMLPACGLVHPVA